MRPFKEELKEAYQLVESCLQEETCRNNDTYLLFQVWAKHTGREVFSIEDAFSLIKPETIRRVRQIIQNEEKRFLPTIPGVLAQRKFKEQEVREHFSQNQPIVSKYLEYIYGVGAA